MSAATVQPPRPPDPTHRSGTKPVATGIFAENFFRALGTDALATAAASAAAQRAHVERYSIDPVAWSHDRAGAHLWSKQREIMESVRDNRRTAVHSAHGVGKSYLAAQICAWWIDAHPPGEAFVVTTATTESQVKAVLWRELSRVHTAASLGGRMTQLEWHLTMPSGKEEIVAFGRKPADMNPTAFQGIHARHVLVLFDEAGGIHSALWEAADSLTSNVHSRFLAIGNPDDPQSEFEKVCRPGSGWNVIHISALDSPNFTGEPVPDAIRDLLVSPEWVAEKLRAWGETNPRYVARVLGIFPDVAEGGLFPAAWIRAAQEFDATAAGLSPYPIELGVDVGAGADKTIVALRNGPRVRIIYRGQNPDTAQSLGVVMRLIAETGATATKIDNIGVGKGIVDRAREIAADQSQPKVTRDRAATIVGIDVRNVPNDRASYINLRAEAFWELRERFQATAAGMGESGIDLDPEDEDLAAQLVDISFKPSSNGKTQVESKEEMKRRGKNSPDEADAVMLAFTGGVTTKKKRAGTWGRRSQGLRGEYR